MHEKVSKSLSLLTILVIVGYMCFQYFTMDSNPHLHKAYSGKMELYHAAQMAVQYEQKYERFLNGRRWPGSHFGMLKRCPTTSAEDPRELEESKIRLAKSFISGKGKEIGEPLLDWTKHSLKKTHLGHADFVRAPAQSSFAWKDSKNADGVSSTEYAVLSMKTMSVDFLIANNILQQTEYTIALLDQLLRVIRRQGYLLLTVPNACSGANRHRVVTDWRHFEEEWKRRRRVVSNHEEHLAEWVLSRLQGNLPDNSTSTLDELVESIRPSNAPKPANVNMNDTSENAASTSQQQQQQVEPSLEYDYHTWDQDSMMEFLTQARSLLEVPYTVRELAVHETELLVVLQKL